MKFYRLAATIAIALSSNAGGLSGVQTLDLSNNEYIKGESVLNRSPCPAINTVANHGFVNRDGTGVLSTDLAEALTLVSGLVWTFPST
mmetsp:Transcript_42195/g.101517  ORF Transcript_42195/g.101517 Transcript_42195/m.101517 type:complete len:88 (+) Transcript_42195:209-472(+)